MQLIFGILSLLCAIQTASANAPQPFVGFEIQSLDVSIDLLTGLDSTPDGIVACDRGQGALLLFPPNQPAQILINNLDTPVDVSIDGDEWLILQEEPGSLIAVDAATLGLRVIADGFQHPSAFALDDDRHAYVIEFDTGFLIRIDLETGTKEQMDVIFDKPADILFGPPNQLIVADQVGSDGRGGAIYRMNMQGEIFDVDRRVTDPTGLALSNSGELYATSFFIREFQMGHENQNDKGGVVRLRSNRDHPIVIDDLLDDEDDDEDDEDEERPKVIVDDLLGPTSLLFEPDGSLIVLEELTDSIYRYSTTGQRTSVVEGFARIQQAVRNTDGAIIAIEGGLFERLRMSRGNGLHQTWAQPEFGNWERAALASDGTGKVYLSEPFLSLVQVFDASGNQANSYRGIVPFYMAGIPSGGVYAFTQSGNATFMTRLINNTDPATIRLDLKSDLTACFVRQDGNLLITTSNGELSVMAPQGNKISTLLNAQSGFRFGSVVQGPSPSHTIWLIEEFQRKVYCLENGSALQPVAQLQEDGVLLPDPEGVLYLSESGKRFLVKQKKTKINNWPFY